MFDKFSSSVMCSTSSLVQSLDSPFINTYYSSKLLCPSTKYTFLSFYSYLIINNLLTKRKISKNIRMLFIILGGRGALQLSSFRCKEICRELSCLRTSVNISALDSVATGTGYDRTSSYQILSNSSFTNHRTIDTIYIYIYI